MKDQYFGDVNDFRKYGFLRSLTASTGLRLGVIWFLTEDDGRADGRFLGYLRQPKRYRHLDEGLFDRLTKLNSGIPRSVKLAKEWRLLPRNTKFSTERLSDDGDDRCGFWVKAMTDTRPCPLLFLDPDNGLEVESVPYNTKGSSKYVYWTDLEDLVPNEISIIVYQHWRREDRLAQIERIRAKVTERWPRVLPLFHPTPRALFVVIAQPEHASPLEAGLLAFKASWQEPQRPH
jgi:hypothetical protein